MRITSTTSAPVSANETTAAGPAACTTTPLPTNRPAPITPPSAISSMCRRRRVRFSPGVESVVGWVMKPSRGRLSARDLRVILGLEAHQQPLAILQNRPFDHRGLRQHQTHSLAL